MLYHKALLVRRLGDVPVGICCVTPYKTPATQANMGAPRKHMVQQHARWPVPTPYCPVAALGMHPKRPACASRFLYYLSYVKVAVAMAMYLPQVLLNHERRSTAGFSIEQVLGSLRFRAMG